MKYILATCIFYTIGIFFNEKFTNLQFLTFAFFITLIIVLINLIFKKASNILLILLCLISSVFGAYWYLYRFPEKDVNDLYYYSPLNNITIEGVVTSEPKLKNEHLMIFKLQVERIIKPYIFTTSSKTQVLLKYTSNLDINYGDRLKLVGDLDIPKDSPNPREISYKKYLARNGIFTVLSVTSTKQVNILEKEIKKDFWFKIFKIKNKILSSLHKDMSKKSADFVGSLLFGSRASPVSDETAKDFMDLQITHILSASGMQVSLIMMFGIFFVSALRINKRLGFIIISTCIIFYMFLTSMPSSILRAGIVSLIVLWAYLRKKKTNSINILVTTYLVITLIFPTLAYDVGFQFSLVSTFGILYFFPRLSKRLIFLPKLLADFISIPISAVLFTLPLQLYYFSYFSYISVFTNIMSSLFVVILTYGGILVLFVSKLGVFLDRLSLLFLDVVNYFASFEFETYVKRPYLTDLFLMYSILFFISEILKKRKISSSKFNLYLSLLFLVISFSVVSIREFSEKNLLKVTFINVGQGDSILIQTPSQKNILIDCGKAYEFYDENKIKIAFDAGKAYIIPYFQHNGIKNIDLLVITHPDIDHYGGFISLAKQINIKKVWLNGQIDINKPFIAMLETIRNKEIPLQIVHREDFYQEKNLVLEVINDVNQEFNTKNNNSIVLKLVYKNNSFLFMGDLEKKEEYKLLNSGINLNSDVLKVSHHGSNTASSSEFLESVKPKISIVSVGRNSYNLPSNKALKRLKEIGTRIYRTDYSGGILITSDGKKLITNTSY